MKQLYRVTFEFEAVVAAEDVTDAYETARSLKRDIVSDDDGILDVDSTPITKAEQLPYPWNDECYPYGGDDDEGAIKAFLQPPAA